MKIYLVSNNLLLDGIDYDNRSNLEIIRMVRPLNTNGEVVSREISELECLKNTNQIISSFHSSALGTAKYLSNKLELDIFMCEKFNDCKVGILGNKNIPMVKGMQEHEFTYKLPNGESLVDVGFRMDNEIKKINIDNTTVFTHKRAILGFLLKYAKVGYNLDGSLILEYNDNIIYDDSETDYDIYEVTINNHLVEDIKRIK